MKRVPTARTKGLIDLSGGNVTATDRLMNVQQRMINEIDAA
jgi:hypothetical protein